MNIFFPGNPLHIKNVSSARPLKISFPSARILKMSFSFFKDSQNFFFPGECFSFIISWRMPLKIFFFLESASQNYFFPEKLFFPGEGPPKYFFSRFPPVKFYIQVSFLHKHIFSFHQKQMALKNQNFTSI